MSRKLLKLKHFGQFYQGYSDTIYLLIVAFIFLKNGLVLCYQNM